MSARRPPEEDDRPPVSLRPSDLPLLYLLALVQMAVIFCLPLAGWVLIRFVGALPGRRPVFLMAALVVVVLLIEVAMVWRVRRLLLRLRDTRPSP